jgi:hypothetical protein
MAFGTPVDHFGFETTDLIPIESSLTPVAQSNADALDENGDIAATAYYGNSSGTYQEASVTYLLKSGTLNINTLTLGEVEAGIVCTNISVATDNSESEFPKITCTGLLGASAITAPTGKSNKFTLPSISIKAVSFAQPMGFTNSGGELNSSSFEASCNLGNATDGAGEPVAFGLSGAQATISAEFTEASDATAWTLSGFTEVQEPSSVAPQAGWGTSTATARAILARGAAAE